MSKSQILIVDDNEGARERWRRDLDSLEAVKQRFEVVSVRNRDFQQALKGLEGRRRQVREGGDFTKSFGQNDLDNASILIVDYDLLGLTQEEYLTGEAVAYLARCFSRCGLIIGLNQFGSNGFDLTLRGHPESFADLNLGDRQVANTGLWKEGWRSFRPWYWPLLPQGVPGLAARAQDVQAHWDEPILSFLGFAAIADTLPRSTLEFIESSKPAPETTFRMFVLESGNALSRKDAEALRRGWDQSPKLVEVAARVAAARIGKWLDHLVLPGQDVLVDAPHLVSRFPSLLTDDAGQKHEPDETVSFASGEILPKKIEPYRFTKTHWLSRPAWWWREITSCQDVLEVADPWGTEPLDQVFCEDISRFVSREEASEFVADLPSPFVRRYVVNRETCKSKDLRDELRTVDYKPIVRLSL